ncbi:sensor histidine kinase [Leptospira ognonensis]|uniref:histidine kinase n=1 Tax=Leptospira ognonensis TaxID=2484945 RepID=A0A4R9JZS1_9LEPT|nr:HAMP domain-containing sensor histidine kinase [Leptospira ognonensis]TGL57898.1 sensor histidine kinase [Leptospira ognonensis]
MILPILRTTSFRKLIYAGVTPNMDLDQSLRLQLANIAAILGVISNLSFSILFFNYDTIGKGLIPLVNTPFGIAIGFTLYLNFKKQYKLARYLLLFCIPVVVLITTALFYGNLLGAHYFFLLFSMLPFLTLSYKDKYKILSYFVFNILLFFYIAYFHKPPFLTPDSPFYDAEVRKNFQLISISICFSIMAIILFYFLRNTNRNQIEMQKTNLYKDRIFSILAHDLKGPIGSMGTFLGILLDSKAKLSEEEMRYGLLELQKNANQCYVVLENLLEWVKKDTNRLQFQPDINQLLKLVRDTLDLFQIQSRDKDLKWKIEISESHWVFVDERMMATVLRNLFSNALKFSKISGEVHVTSKDIGDFIELEVSDNGIGISEEKLSMIRQGMSIKSDFGTLGERGTGIGLLVSFELVHIQNSEIFIESKRDEGTKITVLLPKKEI